MKKLNIPGVPNGYNIDDRVWRSAQPSDDAWAALARAGVVGVIDLNNSGEQQRRQEELILDERLEYWGLDWSGILPPSLDKVEDALRILDVWTPRGPVLVHCQHGSDRTGTLCACWRIRHDGWDFYDAIGEAFFSLGLQGMHEFWMAAAVAEYDCKR